LISLALSAMHGLHWTDLCDHRMRPKEVSIVFRHSA